MSPELNLVVLCAELERLFELDELKELSRQLLGMDPESIGGGSAKGSFVKALTAECARSDRIAALCDAILAWRTDVDPTTIARSRLSAAAAGDELEPGDSLGGYLIVGLVGRGRLGTVYRAHRHDADVRLKVLAREATFDRVGLQRFLTASRIIGTLGHPGLPGEVAAGEDDGRFFVAQPFVEGETLANVLAARGAIPLEEARPILRSILEALAVLHDRRLVHGDLRPENLLIRPHGPDAVLLLDAGSHFLSVQPPAANGHSNRLTVLGSTKTIAPEQIEGHLADVRSDLYSFGALCFEILTGKAAFDGRTPAVTLMARLTREAPLASSVAPPGWLGEDVDEFIAELLIREAALRPTSAADVLDQLDALGATPSIEELISDEEFDERVQALLQDPSNEAAEESLLQSIRQGGSVQQVAETLCDAAESLDAYLGFESRGRLLRRAAGLYETSLKNPEAAETIYAALAEADPDDSETRGALDRLRRQLGKHDEIVEGYLARVDATDERAEKARLLAEIGAIYEKDLRDAEQAVVAYTQAFCESPDVDDYARALERIAGRNAETWGEILSNCVEASSEDRPWPTQVALLVRMAGWYSDKLNRPDLALPCYSAILENDAENADALEGTAAIYRKGQQWNELGHVLIARADAPETPGPLARDLRTEAAEILDMRLGSSEAARALYEQVLSEDPSHKEATDGLARLCERLGDVPGYVRQLERRAEALSGQERLDCLFRIAEMYELRMGDTAEATRRYRALVAEDPKHLEGLQGLDRCLSRSNAFADLIDNLHMQTEAASTPRQKVQLWERIASIWDEEFLDHQRSAQSWENVLDLDSTHDPALTHLARHYRALERWDDLVVVLERHVALLENDDERRIEKSLALGKVLAGELDVPERAIAVYETVLATEPQNAEALEALAGLRMKAGDAEEALQALDRLTNEATTPQARAELYIRAAKLLEAHGDPDGAIDRYKLAIDADPSNRSTSVTLRAAYIARGDNNAAAELLEQEIKNTEGEASRAKLAGEMAALLRDRLGNDDRAGSWAKAALDTDPTNFNALRVLGDIAHDAGHNIEAARYYEQVVNRTDTLPQAEAVRILSAYVTALVKNEQVQKALPVSESLLSLAPDDDEVLERVAQLQFEHGDPQRSFELHWEYLHRAKSRLADEERAAALYRLGESARRAGDLVAAQEPLEEAADLDPHSNDALRALVELQTAKEQWDAVVRTMYRQLENEVGESRVKLLMAIGDLAVSHLKDPSYAAKSYLTALSEKPNDRKILMKLMQLYSEEKDWEHLVKVILKLADFVEDDKQKSKYLNTAGRVAYREMGDARRASQLLQRSLELDADNADVLRDGLEVHRAAGNAEAMKELLKRQVKMSSDVNDKSQMLEALTALADLYLNHFNRLEQAIAVTEAAIEVKPDSVEHKETLARLYALDSAQYRDQAIEAHFALLKEDPFRPELHAMLRRLYTEAKRPDPAWCCCQALAVLGQAGPDEEKFYLRMRTEDGAHVRNRLSDSDFHSLIVHDDADAMLTALFTVIEPAILGARAKSLQEFGYGPEHLIDPTRHQFAAAQTLPWAADVLGIQCPPMLENQNDLGELSFLPTQPPAIVLGTSVIGVALPAQTAAFMAARLLTYFRPGMSVRQFVPTTAGLKAWLFGAIVMMSPQFPIPGDVQVPARDALGAVERLIVGGQREHLARIVSKLLQGGSALDLKRWSRAIDLTADRAGLVLADDLQTAVDMIRSSDPRSAAATVDERIEEIYRYAVSEQYFKVRQALGIAIDT